MISRHYTFCRTPFYSIDFRLFVRELLDAFFTPRITVCFWAGTFQLFMSMSTHLQSFLLKVLLIAPQRLFGDAYHMVFLDGPGATTELPVWLLYENQLMVETLTVF